MRIAHPVRVIPGRSGLYESTREIVAALRALGHDSRMIPTQGPGFDDQTVITFPPGTTCIIESGTEFDPETAGTYEDRGVPTAPDEWLTECDIVLNHEYFSAEQRKLCPDTPVIQVLHGAPEYGFRMENMGGIRAYSSMKTIQEGPNAAQWRAFLTFWPQHVPYWEVIIPPDMLHCVQSCVDLEYWDPAHVEPDYDFGGTRAEINVVCSSSWRPGNVDIFDVVTAFYHFADSREKGKCKLHIYGGKGSQNLPSDAWRILVKRLRECDMLGEMPGWVSTKRMRQIYRSADMVITPHHVATRGVREPMAMGCPVIADEGYGLTGDWWRGQRRRLCYTADIRDTRDFEAFMGAGVDDLELFGENVRKVMRASAKRCFDPAVTAREIVEVIEGVLA